MNWAATAERFSQSLLAPENPAPDFVSGERRYAVYRNNVTIGLIRAIEGNFPVVRRLLGAAYFGGLAREYAQAHPPRNPLMFMYGEHLPEFLEAQKDLADFPYLGDVARLEILMRKSYHETDGPVFGTEELTGLGEDDLMGLVVKPHPAMFMLVSQHAVVSITQVNRGEGDPAGIDPTQAEIALVTRPHFEVQLATLSRAEHRMFALLAAGQDLGTAFAAAFELDEAFDVNAGLQRILTSGAFTSN